MLRFPCCLCCRLKGRGRSEVAEGLGQLGEGLGQVVGAEDGAVVLVGVLHEVDAVAHLGLEDDAHGAALAGEGLGAGHAVEHLLHVVAVVDDDDLPEEALELGLEVAEGHDLLDGGVDLLVVVVDGGDEVVHVLGAGEHGGFPDLAFLELAVAVHGEDEVFVARHFLAEGGADADAEALTQRAAGHADARQVVRRGGVALQAGAEEAEGAELADGEVAAAGHGAVDDGGDVALADEEHVLAVAAHGEVLGLEVHDVPVHGHEPVRRAHRAAGMAALGGGGHSQNIAAHLRRNLLKFCCGFHCYVVLLFLFGYML